MRSPASRSSADPPAQRFQPLPLLPESFFPELLPESEEPESEEREELLLLERLDDGLDRGAERPPESLCLTRARSLEPELPTLLEEEFQPPGAAD